MFVSCIHRGSTCSVFSTNMRSCMSMRRNCCHCRPSSFFALYSVKHPSMMPMISADSFPFTMPEMSYAGPFWRYWPIGVHGSSFSATVLFYSARADRSGLLQSFNECLAERRSCEKGSPVIKQHDLMICFQLQHVVPFCCDTKGQVLTRNWWYTFQWVYTKFKRT